MDQVNCRIVSEDSYVLSKEDNVETSIRVVLFSGDKRDWMTWEEKYLARASSKGFKKTPN